jgi:hypothetical protein
MTVAPGEDEGASHQSDERVTPSQDGNPGASAQSWRSEASDAEVDAAFAAIVSGIVTNPELQAGMVTNPELQAGVDRHPSSGRRLPDTSEDRARRRELRRLERAEEVAAFAAHQAEVEAERAADEAHFTPPEPPPLPRPKGRTIGAVLMLLGGLVLLARPGLLAIGFDLTLILAVILMLGGSAILLAGIWKRRGGGDADGWDDGAVV